MKRFTHFLDKTDGTGDYRDYAGMTAVLRAHSRAIKKANTARSVVKDYGHDGLADVVLADWPNGVTPDIATT